MQVKSRTPDVTIKDRTVRGVCREISLHARFSFTSQITMSESRVEMADTIQSFNNNYKYVCLYCDGFWSRCVHIKSSWLVSSWILTSRQQMGSPQDESHIQNYIFFIDRFYIALFSALPLYQSKTQVIKSQVCLIHCYSVKNQPSIYLSMHSSTRFGAYLYSVGTHHGNQLKSLVTEQDDLLYSTGPHERRGFKEK